MSNNDPIGDDPMEDFKYSPLDPNFFSSAESYGYGGDEEFYNLDPNFFPPAESCSYDVNEEFYDEYDDFEDSNIEPVDWAVSLIEHLDARGASPLRLVELLVECGLSTTEAIELFRRGTLKWDPPKK